MKETSLTECKATERYVESPGVIASGVGARVRNENIGSITIVTEEGIHSFFADFVNCLDDS